MSRKFVGLILILAQSFKEIGFLKPQESRDGLYLTEFDGEVDDVIKVLTFIREKCVDDGRQIVELIPVPAMVHDPFYSKVVAHNLNVLKARGLDIVKKISSKDLHNHSGMGSNLS